MITIHIKETEEHLDTHFEKAPQIGEIIAYDVGTEREFYEVIGIIHNCERNDNEISYSEQSHIKIEVYARRLKDISHLD